METMDEKCEVDETNTFVVNFFSNPQGTFCTSTQPFQMYILENNDTSPLCILCTLMPRIIPLPTLTLVRMWYEESTLQDWASTFRDLFSLEPIYSPCMTMSTIFLGLQGATQRNKLGCHEKPMLKYLGPHRGGGQNHCGCHLFGATSRHECWHPLRGHPYPAYHSHLPPLKLAN